jgi:hypothetical protein
MRPLDPLRVVRLGASVSLLGMAVLTSSATAQVAGAGPPQVQISTEPVESRNHVSPVPFGPGELLRYKVKMGAFSVGEAYLAVTTVDTVRGNPAYHAVMRLSGGIPLARVEDTFQTWIDIGSLFSHRFRKDQDEVGYKRLQHLEFFPNEGEYADTVSGWRGPLVVSRPLDDISFIYFVRSLPLEVGDTYYLNRYYTETGNPVKIHVERIDTVEVPAGTFETLVIKPEGKTKGLFSQGGEAEIHLSNDENRVVVYLRTRMPVLKSLTLHLEELQLGRPIKSGFYELTPEDLAPDSMLPPEARTGPPAGAPGSSGSSGSGAEDSGGSTGEVRLPPAN